MGGFLAAIFMRGIPVIHVPTTLLAQVDAAIGGKTGVNLAIGKNLIGSFHQPLEVWIDPAVLDTLPDREYRAGLFEIVKAGIIRDAGLFRFLTERSGDVLARAARSRGPHHRRCGPHEGRGGLRGRTRERPAAHPQLGPYLRTRARSRDRLHAVPTWRGGGFRHARRGPPGSEYRLLVRGGQRRDPRGSGSLRPHPAVRRNIAGEPIGRLVHDKKTIGGKVHFVVPVRIGEAEVVSGISVRLVLEAIRSALS